MESDTTSMLATLSYARSHRRIAAGLEACKRSVAFRLANPSAHDWAGYANEAAVDGAQALRGYLRSYPRGSFGRLVAIAKRFESRLKGA
jgi:hypothetical protein